MLNISKNPKVCFEVDAYEKMEGQNPCDYSYKYHSVIVLGIAKQIDNTTARLSAMKRLSNKYAPGKGKLIGLADLGKYKDLIVYSIEINEMTGKRSPVKTSSG